MTPHVHLHVVVSVEGFSTDRAGELGGTNEDLGRCRDPVVCGVEGADRRGGGGGERRRANVHCDGDGGSILMMIRVLKRRLLLLLFGRE